MFHFAFWLTLLLPGAIYFNQWVLFLILVFPLLIMWLGIFTTGSPPLTMKHSECAIHKTHMMTPTWQPSASLQSLTSFCCLSHSDSLSRCSPLFAAKHLEKSDILEVNRATAVHQLPPFPLAISLFITCFLPVPFPLLPQRPHVQLFKVSVVLSFLSF